MNANTQIGVETPPEHLRKTRSDGNNEEMTSDLTWRARCVPLSARGFGNAELQSATF